MVPSSIAVAPRDIVAAAMAAPTNDEIRHVVALELGVKRVRAEDRLVDDLGVESMDLVSILAAVEDRWGIATGKADLSAVRTVADFCALVTSLAGQARG
jgi:acyl carrier protein